MDREKIFVFLENIVGKFLTPEETFSEELSFTDDIGFDSLDTTELIMECEAEFNSRIPDNIAERLVTVGDLIDAVLKYPRS